MDGGPRHYGHPVETDTETRDEVRSTSGGETRRLGIDWAGSRDPRGGGGGWWSVGTTRQRRDISDFPTLGSRK